MEHLVVLRLELLQEVIGPLRRFGDKCVCNHAYAQLSVNETA